MWREAHRAVNGRFLSGGRTQQGGEGGLARSTLYSYVCLNILQPVFISCFDMESFKDK